MRERGAGAGSGTATDLQPAGESPAALARYGSRMRRQRLQYFVLVAALLVAVVVIASVAYARGEVHNTTLHTVGKPPANLALGTPAQTQHLAWRTSDTAAIGSPQWNGTIVTYSKHTVRGINARTGKQTWSYTRSDRTVCSAAQLSGTTIASYELAGNCDELTGLDSDTGERRWTRTLDEDGQPLFGHPTYQTLPNTLMITTPSVIYTIDQYSGYDDWVYSRYGCRIEHAVLGSPGGDVGAAAALISQHCTAPRCATQQFCARGQQLLLRTSTGSKSSDTTNPDMIKWNLLGDTDIPVSADGLVSALNTTTHTLDTLNLESGKPAGSVPLKPAPTALSPITAVAVDGPELIWIGGISYLVASGATNTAWSAQTPGPPSVAIPNGGSTYLRDARISVGAASGVRLLNGQDGTTRREFAVSPAPATGSTVYSLGTGFLVASRTGVAAYQ